MTEGLVTTGRNNIFTVQVDGEELLCRLKGKRLEVEERAYNPLAPGDLVEVGSVDTLHKTGIIERRMDRRNAFLRFNRKRNAPQTLAANIDRVYCVASVGEPEFKPRFVDRVLALAEDQGVSAGVVVNKADLNGELAFGIVARYREIGYPAIAASSPSSIGLDELRESISGGISVFVGQSGVGKSTLLNGLFGRAIQTVGRVSNRYRRGRHTTNAAALIQEGDLRIVDTPGVRELDVRTIDQESLAWCFVEFRPLLGSCGHSDCAHLDERDCAVRSAALAGEVAWDRYESYIRLLDELQELEMQ